MVQDLGLDILQRLDTINQRIERGEQNAFGIRLARLSAGESVIDVFPEYFSQASADADADDDLSSPDVDYDYSGVTYATDSIESEAALLQQFLGQTSISVPTPEMEEWH